MIEEVGTLRTCLLSDSKAVTCYVTDDVATEDIEHVLRDLVLPKLLALQGNLVLHGGLVARTGCPGFCLIGASGYGKSTLSASLRKQGLDLLSDDSVVIDPTGPVLSAEGLCAQPRLFPDSLAHLFPDPVASAPVVSYTDKRRVHLQETTLARAPVAAIFVLAPPETATCDVTLAAMPQAAACMALVANSFALNPADPFESRQRFALAAKVARRVPLLELSYPRDYNRLSDVHSAILGHLDDTKAEQAEA